MAASPDRRTQSAAKAWRLMFDFLMQSGPERLESLQKRGLTPNDSRALFALDEGQGRPIGTLARQWGCDPSTATWLVDRLAKAGFAERCPSTEDRRVKPIRLTRKGATTTKALMEEYYLPPPAMIALSPAELNALTALLEKLTSGST
jgi:DNA-binding MarR family transcriptional regulator